MAKPVALWSTPRSVSTAFDKMMRGRGDHRVFTEPFSVPFYFGAERRSDRYADEADPSAAYEEVWTDVVGAADRQPVFIKEMPHQLGPYLVPEAIGRFTSSFLIRDPARSVPSCLAMWPDATDEELGYEAQWAAFEMACDQDGQAPPVIDAHDLRADPASVVEAWCEAVDVPFVEDSLTWKPGLPEEWDLWSEWFTRAAASSEFALPDDAPEPEVTPAVQTRIDRCRSRYEALRAHRIAGPGS